MSTIWSKFSKLHQGGKRLQVAAARSLPTSTTFHVDGQMMVNLMVNANIVDTNFDMSMFEGQNDRQIDITL
jgi:hypothetical protein